jgi:hypothetical protein
MIQDALGIESDDVVNYCFPMNWPEDRNGPPASSASGSKPRRVIWPRDRPPPLPAALPTSFGGALRRPFGLAPVIIRHLEYSG